MKATSTPRTTSKPTFPFSRDPISTMRPSKTGLEMSLIDTTSDNTTLLKTGGLARFRCRVRLDEPIPYSDMYDGLTLEVLTSGGNQFEDGCFSKVIIPADQRFMTEARKHCPQYSATAKEYYAEIVFTIPSPFVGTNQYRCNFRRQYYYYPTLSYYPTIAQQSEPVNLTGVSLPTLKFTPAAEVAGFEGESIVISCSSTGGYPLGEVQLETSRGPLENSKREETYPSTTTIRTILKLSEEHMDMQFICSNTIYPQYRKKSAPVVVKQVKLIGTDHLAIADIETDLYLDCTNNITTNTALEFLWSGVVIPQKYKMASIAYIPYSVSRHGGTHNITCNITMTGDPRRRVLTRTYTLLYTPAQVVNLNASKSNTIGVAAVIALILAVTGVAVSYAVMSEISLRKNSVVRVAPGVRDKRISEMFNSQDTITVRASESESDSDSY